MRLKVLQCYGLPCLLFSPVWPDFTIPSEDLGTKNLDLGSGAPHAQKACLLTPEVGDILFVNLANKRPWRVLSHKTGFLQMTFKSSEKKYYILARWTSDCS